MIEGHTAASFFVVRIHLENMAGGVRGDERAGASPPIVLNEGHVGVGRTPCSRSAAGGSSGGAVLACAPLRAALDDVETTHIL